jgi:hypothetical protein
MLLYCGGAWRVVFMAPGAYTAYYYPLLFCGYLFVLILASFCSAGRKKKRLVRMHGETE